MKRPFRNRLAVMFLAAGAAAAGCEKALKFQVQTDPPGAKLYWNTQPAGTTPCTVLLPKESEEFPEVHVFEARKSGYEPKFYYLTSRPKPSMFGKAEITFCLTKLPEGVSDADVPAALPRGAYRRRKKASPYEGYLACEARLVRVSDGRVLAQACGFAAQKHLDQCAESLAEQLKAKLPPGRKGELAVATTRNRRESEPGQALAKKMTLYLQREMSFNSPLGLVKEMDFNGLVREDMKDVSYILRDPDLAAELQGARYIVLSGLAESVDP
ncbi:MAG: hypothetical protein JW849_04870 [Phycisphaerae bacterium]|nr:hypothetical protein [Phycisphaerae bacterium]